MCVCVCVCERERERESFLCFLQLQTWFERATSGPSSGGGEGVYQSPKSAEGFALCYGQGNYKLVTYQGGSDMMS